VSTTAPAPRHGRLRRADCAGPGIKRVRRGRGFSFSDCDGTSIEDEETLERIRQLAIPPAWKEVWICPDPFGHIQATGYDEAGRKQYLYHGRWQQRQAERKFELVREFALKLPRLRRAVTADLRRTGMPRERALACAIRLLDLGFFRVGSEVYAEENESFGLATVRREHVTVGKSEVVFDALGNTPAVCRASYIDPRVLDRYRDGVTIKPPTSTNGKLTAKARRQIEKEVIALTA
jgi:DNA topoisomerase-1